MPEDAMISERDGEASGIASGAPSTFGRWEAEQRPGQDALTGREWRSVVGLVLEQMGSASLPPPEEHLDYVRKRIRAAVARRVV